MPVKWIFLSLAVVGLGHAADVTVHNSNDAREIVRQSIRAEIENSKRAGNYTFLQRAEDREMDDKGRVTSTESKTYDVTMLAGSSYRRLIERNDRPLAAREEKKEQEKLQQSIDARRHETPAQRNKRIAQYNNRPGRSSELLNEIPEAFVFRLRGEEAVSGKFAYVIEGVPDPAYRPKSSEGRTFLPRLKLTVWIDKADHNWVRLHAEVIEPISLALCLVRLSAGAQFDLRQTYVNNEVWMPHVIRITGSARVALIKKINMQQEYTFRNFRRFQTDSQIVTTAAAREPR